MSTVSGRGHAASLNTILILLQRDPQKLTAHRPEHSVQRLRKALRVIYSSLQGWPPERRTARCHSASKLDSQPHNPGCTLGNGHTRISHLRIEYDQALETSR